MLFVILSILLTILIYLLFVILSKSYLSNSEKISPFECGFEPFSLSRLPFSLRFFKITLIFLIFDIEIVMVLSLCFSQYNLNSWFFLNSTFLFLLIYLGTIYEWVSKNFEWMNLMSI